MHAWRRVGQMWLLQADCPMTKCPSEARKKVGAYRPGRKRHPARLDTARGTRTPAVSAVTKTADKCPLENPHVRMILLSRNFKFIELLTVFTRIVRIAARVNDHFLPFRKESSTVSCEPDSAIILDTSFTKAAQTRQKPPINQGLFNCLNQFRSAFAAAENGGFEPPRACTQPTFQAGAIGH